MNQRYLSLYFPWWSISVAMRREQGMNQSVAPADDLPVVLYLPRADRIPIARFCKRAQALGAALGMPKALAESILPAETRFCAWDSVDEFRALCRLARWATRITPLVAIDSEAILAYRNATLDTLSPLHAGLVLDISGTERVHRGEESLVRSILRVFSRRGLETRAASCSSAAAAWALARFASTNPCLVPQHIGQDGLQQYYIAPLPMRALRVSCATEERLSQFGLTTIADVMSLPRKKLALRFGEELLTQLDLVCGRRHGTLRFIREHEPFAAERSFDIPLHNHESIQMIAKALLERVCKKLAAHGQCAQIFRIEFILPQHHQPALLMRKELALAHATKDFRHAATVLEPLLQSLRAPEGVSRISITALQLNRVRNETQALDKAGRENASDAHASQELMNHFVARLGPARVTRLALAASYIPEKSFAHEPLHRTNVRTSSAASNAPFLDRPSHLFSAPHAVRAIAMLPDQPPSVITWGGTRLKIVRGIGPERICTEWWHAPLGSSLSAQSGACARDYFRIQDEQGRWLWVFRNTDTLEWFVHGIWN